MYFDNMDETEITEYMDSILKGDSGYEEKKERQHIKEQYKEDIGKIRNRLDRLSKEVEIILTSVKNEEYDKSYEVCHRAVLQGEKIVRELLALPVQYGERKAYERIKEWAPSALKLEIDIAGEILHIKLPELLPSAKVRINGKFTEGQDYDYNRVRYVAAFRQAMGERRFPVYQEKAVIVYIHFYTHEDRLVDHDNLDWKMVQDILCGYLLFDDNPKWCANYMDFRYGETRHTEIFVMPNSVFPELVYKI